MSCFIYRTTRTCLPRYVSKAKIRPRRPSVIDIIFCAHIEKSETRNEKNISLLYLCAHWSELLLVDCLFMVQDFSTYCTGEQRRLTMRSFARAFSARINKVTKVQSKFIPLASLGVHVAKYAFYTILIRIFDIWPWGGPNNLSVHVQRKHRYM